MLVLFDMKHRERERERERETEREYLVPNTPSDVRPNTSCVDKRRTLTLASALIVLITEKSELFLFLDYGSATESKECRDRDGHNVSRTCNNK